MKKFNYSLLVSCFFLVLASCSNNYDKTPEDWSLEICKCASDKGYDSKEVKAKLDELKGYYSEDDNRMHDKATTLIGQYCPQVFLQD